MKSSQYKEPLVRARTPCKTAINGPRYEKTGFLHMRKQRCRSASR